MLRATPRIPGALVYATPNRPRLNALDASPSPFFTKRANSSKETSPLASVSAAANVCAAVASSVLMPKLKRAIRSSSGEILPSRFVSMNLNLRFSASSRPPV